MYFCLCTYYPPYHSKYNPVERVWGRLEQHWNEGLLDKVEKIIGLTKTMTRKGWSPVVTFVKKRHRSDKTGWAGYRKSNFPNRGDSKMGC
ncbi:ISAzo13-like element transposase-related protein [Desulfobacter hydrogenophilus]|uniref:ISAzo13-like element transposase-related protein n=1 Tax=Desulfobacter hydrogenophilus TaxID=2291 RepID=UPI0034D23DEE